MAVYMEIEELLCAEAVSELDESNPETVFLCVWMATLTMIESNEDDNEGVVYSCVDDHNRRRGLYMPHILFRGVEAETLSQVSESLAQELAEICACGTDNFTFECLNTTVVFGGDISAPYSFIQVGWFERGDEVRDRFAEAVTRKVKSLGVAEVEVVFIAYEEKAYYIDGKRCDRT